MTQETVRGLGSHPELLEIRDVRHRLFHCSGSCSAKRCGHRTRGDVFGCFAARSSCERTAAAMAGGEGSKTTFSGHLWSDRIRMCSFSLSCGLRVRAAVGSWRYASAANSSTSRTPTTYMKYGPMGIPASTTVGSYLVRRPVPIAPRISRSLAPDYLALEAVNSS